MNATGQRWANELADSNLNIHYNPGRNHIDEDYLSRFPQDKREYTHRSFKKEMKDRGGSRTAATSKMERFVIIVNGFKPLTIITKRSILNVAAVLDPPLKEILSSISAKTDSIQLAWSYSIN